MTAFAWSENYIPGCNVGPYDSGGEPWAVQVVVGGTASPTTTTTR
jgi:hypothetical protein